MSDSHGRRNSDDVWNYYNLHESEDLSIYLERAGFRTEKENTEVISNIDYIDLQIAAFPDFAKGPAEFLLAAECYWLGCLMALNSPPLHPKWPSADEEKKNEDRNWTVFPLSICS
ncbi:hypothetical protein WMY93_033537 [Mugilogobius chulae]|uniref:Uncharacterized protein n=1 Tax=Mugilogobius chulae TaxID=88201 RepID=A0AAW0MKZ3_9GOBI